MDGGEERGGSSAGGMDAYFIIQPNVEKLVFHLRLVSLSCVGLFLAACYYYIWTQVFSREGKKNNKKNTTHQKNVAFQGFLVDFFCVFDNIFYYYFG